MAFRPPPTIVRRGAAPTPAPKPAVVPRPADEEKETDDKPLVGGIAARIAALQLDKVGVNPPTGGPPPKAGPSSQSISKPKGFGRPPVPPVVPRRVVSAVVTPTVNREEHEEDASSDSAPSVSPPTPQRPGNLKVQHGSEILLQTVGAEALARALRRPPPLPPRPGGQAKPAPPQPTEESDEEADTASSTSIQPPSAPALPPRRTVPTLPSRSTATNAKPPQEQQATEEGTTSSLPVRRLPPPPSRTLAPLEHKPLIRPPSRQKTPSPPPPEPEYEEQEEEAETAHSQSASDDEVCMKCRDFSVVDAHAAQFPKETVGSIPQLAVDLTAPFDSVTDKARAIFTWLHHNIAYDAYSFLNNCVKPQTPLQTLRSGMAVCEGYAGLFADLALHAGLQALKVTGHGKGYGYTSTTTGIAPPFESNHAWSAVVLDDNEWHLIDACWGAGHLKDGAYQKEFAPQWFTMDNVEFGQRHFPSEAGYQLREDGTTMTWEEYILSPAGVVEFQGFRKMEYDLNSLLPQSKALQRGQWHTFHIEKTCWHIERNEWWQGYVLLIQPSEKERIVMDRDERGPGNGWTTKAFVPANSVRPVVLYYVDTVDGKDAKGLQPEDVKRFMGRKAMTFAGVAQWDVC
jgi:transglutaminase-like putative cysteine protease